LETKTTVQTQNKTNKILERCCSLLLSSF